MGDCRLPTADCPLGRARGGEPMRCAALSSPVGPLYAAFSGRGLCRLAFGRGLSQSRFAAALPACARPVERHAAAVGQLAAELAGYFGGATAAFATPLDLSGGTPFQQRVWAALRGIPFGATASYGDVARAVGSPRAARAVGQAAGANPVAIVVPCHRVVRAGGALGGFSAGLPIKRWLLRHERL